MAWESTVKRYRVATMFASKITLVRTVFAIVALVSLIAKPVAAQNEDVQTDIGSNLNDLALTRNQANVTPPVSAIHPLIVYLPKNNNYFWVLLSLPETYNSNLFIADTGGVGSDRFDPKFQINFAQQFGHFQFAVNSAFDADRYGQLSAADGNTWLSSVKLNYIGTPAPDVVPYLLYQPSLKYGADFSHTISQSYDYGGGLGLSQSALGLGGLDPHWKVVLDLNGTRRISGPGDSASLSLKSTVAYLPEKSLWKLFFSPNFRVRWYDKSLPITRQDESLILPAVVQWNPHFLDSVDGDILFSVSYVRNFSNIPSKQGNQWNIGPTLELSAPIWDSPTL
jgi:hypothetical protein